MPSYIWILPLYVWMPQCLDNPCKFGHPYVWMPPVCLDGPVYVWMLAVHIQQKESMLCQTEVVSICPIHLDAPCMFGHPHMFGCPSYLWVHIHFGGIQTYRGPPNIWRRSKHTEGVQTCGGHLTRQRDVQTGGIQTWGVQRCEGCPNMQVGIQTYGASKHMEAFKHTGGASKHMAASKHMGASKCMGGIWTSLSLTKHALFVLFMYRGHPNVWGIWTPLV